MMGELTTLNAFKSEDLFKMLTFYFGPKKTENRRTVLFLEEHSTSHQSLADYIHLPPAQNDFDSAWRVSSRCLALCTATATIRET